MFDAFAKTVRTASAACGAVAGALVAGAVLVVCQMVFMRYVLNESTVWQTEFVTYALVAATLIGCPYVQMRRGHVNVDLLPLYLGHRGRIVLAVIALLATILFCATLGWKGYALFHEALTEGWVTDTVWELPLWIPYLPLPLGIGLLVLQLFVDLIELLRDGRAPFGLDPARNASAVGGKHDPA